MSKYRFTALAVTVLALFAGLWFVIHVAAQDKRQSTPFLDRADYSDRLGVVMRDALASHRFLIPWIVVRASDGSSWFVAERFQSEQRFDRIEVQVTPDEHVTASITPYQFGPSEWTILGKLFVDFRPEAEVTGREIVSKLSEKSRVK